MEVLEAVGVLDGVRVMVGVRVLMEQVVSTFDGIVLQVISLLDKRIIRQCPRSHIKQNRTSGLAHAVLMGISLLWGGGFGGSGCFGR